MQNSKERFSDRVADYALYRPSYPLQVFDFIESALGLKENAEIADIGAGTGIFSRQLLERGYRVTSVEPNEPMRKRAEADLSLYPSFRSIGAPAEATGLEDHQFDAVTVAQAFHWFDTEVSRREFKRILKPAGWVCLLWNARAQSTPFMQAVNQLIREHAIEFDKVGLDESRRLPKIDAFFGVGRYQTRTWHYQRDYSADEFIGFFRSASYMPAPGTDAYLRWERAFRDLHAQFAGDDGLAPMLWTTELHSSQL